MSRAGGAPHAGWLRRTPARRAAASRLVCLPHAGGGPSAFAGWPSSVPDDVEVVIAQLPGREARIREAPADDLAAIVGPLAAAIPTDLPLVLFGHSLGAAVALEVVHRLEAGGGPGAAHLIVSGAPAPHLPPVVSPMADLPRAELVARLGELNGVPREVIGHDALMDLLLPSIRADLRLAESYVPTRSPVRCPISVFGGVDDPLTSVSSLDSWRGYTSGRFRRVMFPGDHFFHVSGRSDVVAAVVAATAEAATSVIGGRQRRD